MNDPNGMVYYEGEYHLFYQYYPDSTVWGPMHWGHAISTDLTHWEHLPIALYPDSLGLIFSGSAVIDWNNTTNFGSKDKPAMVAIYNYHDMEGEQTGKHDFQTQGVAYSTDKGRTWTKYEGNPVIPNTNNIHDFRDPKVFWHKDSEKWVMILATNDKVKIYTSDNLLTWEFASDFGFGHGSQARPWECPDLFELTTAEGESKWVMIVSIGNRLEEEQAPNGGSGTMYFIGDFDGKSFTNSNPKEKTLWIDYGRDNYAGVTYSDIPENDDRRLFIGWMSNWNYAQVVPTEVWRSAMTVSRVLTLHKKEDGYLVYSNPIKEFEQLRTTTTTIEETMVESRLDLSKKGIPSQSQWTLEFTPTDATDFGIELSNTKREVYKIGYDAVTNEFYSDRMKSGKTDFSKLFAAKIHTAPRNSTAKTVKFNVIFDLASAELFADDGATSLTDIFFPTEDFNSIVIYTNRKLMVSGKAYNLSSIYE